MQTFSASLDLLTNSIGNEDDFNITLDIIVNTTNNNSDENLDNNRCVIPFTISFSADINVVM